MLTVVSPAKKLNENAKTVLPTTLPGFQSDAVVLAETAQKLTSADLQKLMGISENLGKLNVERFAKFDVNPETDAAVPAALMFAGDTYAGLEAASLDDEEFLWAQDHLRILSGLYGLLKPLDLIQPYRLEMGSKMHNPNGKNLYEYWGGKISEALNKQGEALGTDALVNCASVEYFGAVSPKNLKLRVITPVFMEEKAGQAKIVSFFAKKARGAMARFMIERRLTDPNALKEFDTGGYKFNPKMSEGDRWVFLRDYPTT
ncbi:peroxide stress protein YaaA [Cochlodiniinecator piscidefendens]|uniref:peroxide stress protein YaaA n=1 Tax=Cochlodiniinecator piscidefendens TaxID=2715756 RepID=UPI00140CCC7A|nr:peroxide stress protein YaaA [Cochlodiniinecator piscidefendens]